MKYDNKRVVLHWWQSLILADNELDYLDVKPLPKSYRCQLRRCDSVDKVIMTEAFRSLWQALDKTKSEYDQPYMLECWATIASVLPYVKEDNETTLAKASGKRSARYKPVVSEIRFAQLQSSQSANEFSRRMRDVIQLIKGKLAVTSLAEDIQSWFQEKNQLQPRSAENRIAVNWAMEYYSIINTPNSVEKIKD